MEVAPCRSDSSCRLVMGQEKETQVWSLGSQGAAVTINHCSKEDPTFVVRAGVPSWAQGPTHGARNTSSPIPLKHRISEETPRTGGPSIWDPRNEMLSPWRKPCRYSSLGPPPPNLSPPVKELILLCCTLSIPLAPWNPQRQQNCLSFPPIYLPASQTGLKRTLSQLFLHTSVQAVSFSLLPCLHHHPAPIHPT